MRLKTTLRPYQAEAVLKARSRSGFAFYCEPRTGKTLIALATAVDKKVKRLLILAPANAVPEWKRQLPVHLDYDPDQVKLMSIGQVRTRVPALRRWKPDMVILDEGHRIKRRGSGQSRKVRLISKTTPLRVLLTGTPIGQGSQDAWAQLNFLDRDNFRRYDDFAKRYLIMGGFKGKKVIGYRNRHELAAIIENYSYRVTLREARGEGARILRRVHMLPMADDQKRAYAQAEAGLIDLGDAGEIEVDAAMTVAIKLQQITGGGIILPEGAGIHWLTSPKLDWLSEEFNRLTSPVVVVARFVHELEAIVGLARARGRTVERITKDFSGKVTCDVSVLQIQSAVSIDLSVANRIIYYSWNHSHLDHEQSRFRILSYSSSKVTYDYLAIADSVDLLLYETIRRKAKFATLLIDHYRSKRKWTTSKARSLA